MYTLRQKIRLWALYSRSLILALQFLVDFAIPDYKTLRGNTDGLLSDIKEKANFTFEWLQNDFAADDDDVSEGDHVVDFLFGGLFKDEESQVNLGATTLALYIFGHISHRGYTYELTLTHFPLLPLLVRTVSNGLDWLSKDLCSVLHFYSLVKVTCIGLNFVAFLVAADLLYSLSRRVLKDEYLAYKSVLLFCLTPTAVFFSGAHVDTFLAMATFAAMLVLERSGLGLVSGLLLALCTSLHPSGLLHLGLVLHRSMKQVATSTILYVREKKKISTNKSNKDKKSGPPKPAAATAAGQAGQMPALWPVFSQIAVGAFIPGVWNLVLCLFPFAAYQWFAYAAFCRLTASDVELSATVKQYGADHGLKMPGDTAKPDWCRNDPPISYFSVQSMSWPADDEQSTKGIDIMVYSSVGQLPYLISSAPTLALVFWQSFVFLSVHRRFCFRLGLVDNTQLGMAKPKAPPVTRTRALPRECLVYLFHALTLACAGFLSLPIQISNRLILCSSPVLYWIGAMVTTPSEISLVPTSGSDESSTLEENEAALKVETPPNLKNLHLTILLLEGPSDDLGNATKIFFLGYCVIGTVFHVNGFPWT